MNKCTIFSLVFSILNQKNANETQEQKYADETFNQFKMDIFIGKLNSNI